MKLKAQIIIFLLISCCGCKSFHYLPTDIQGEYIEKLKNGSKTGIRLIFGISNFALVENNKNVEYNTFICCDTITYGDWEIDNYHGIIALSNTSSLSSFVKMSVVEGRKFNNDSLYFDISNPIEQKMGGTHKDIEYVLNLDSTEPFDQSSLAVYKKDRYNLEQDLADKEFDSNKIVLSNPNHSKIRSFRIDIIPKCSFRGRNIAVRVIHSMDYTVLSDQSPNLFKINIPDLTYKYIAYLRLDNDFVKVIDKNTLEWKGLLYIKAK